jgi:hypothetical protein
MAKKKKKASELDKVDRGTYKKNELLPPAANTKVQFKSWFINLLSSDPRIKQHHFEQIGLFVRGLGLSEIEEPARYAKALKTYFGE